MKFDLHENEAEGGTDFYMKWFRTKICCDIEATDNS